MVSPRATQALAALAPHVAVAGGLREKLLGIGRALCPTSGDALLVDLPGLSRRLVAGGETAPAVVELIAPSIPLRGDELPVRVDDLAAIAGSPTPDSGCAAELQRLGASSVWRIPLRAGNDSLGLLWVGSLRGGAGAELDSAGASSLGAVVGAAIAAAVLFDRMSSQAAGRDQALHVLSHDLRNPLSNIHMAADELGRIAVPSSQRYVDIIRRATRQMNRLMQDVLEIARIEAGRVVLDAARQDLRAIADEAITQAAALGKAPPGPVRVEIPTSLPAVRVDRDRLAHALVKLLDNAHKHGGGDVTLRASRVGEEIVLCVVDRGPGMTPELLENAFDRMWHAKRQDRRGPGLGLAIARGLVQAHGGRLWIESTVGQGTEVHVALPLGLDEVAPAPPSAPRSLRRAPSA